MRRKLVKQGRGAIVVTLPKHWIDKRELHARDEVDIEEFSKGVLITPAEKEKKQKSIELDLTKQQIAETRLNILHAYSVGFNSIKIKSNNEGELKKITKNYLEGFELTKISDNEYILEEITEATKKDILYFITKTFWILKELINEIENDTSEQFENAGRFHFFIRRYIYKTPLSERKKIYLTEFSTDLEYVATIIHHLNINLKKKKIGLNKTQKELTETIKHWLFTLYESYEKRDPKKLPELNEKIRNILYHKGLKLLEKDPLIYYHLLSIIRSTYRASLTLLGLLQTEMFEKNQK